jgi:hypothetical protein
VLRQVGASELNMAECYRQHISAISRTNKGRLLLSLEKNNKKSLLECKDMLIASGTRYVGQSIEGLSANINL